LLVSVFVVAVYAFCLAFQARGKPDQTLIDHFAASSSRGVTVTAGIIVTFLLANYIVRKGPRHSVPLGVVVGLSSGVVSVMIALAFHAHFGLGSALVPLLLLLVGWFGALRGSSRKPPQPAA
jgi:uncharacterized membrane protein